jgi:hypothetical protein
MRRFEDEPLSPLDQEIETLLERLAAFEANPPTPDERPVVEVAIKAIRDRLKVLSRKCTDDTCRIRVIQEVRKAVDRDD